MQLLNSWILGFALVLFAPVLPAIATAGAAGAVRGGDPAGELQAQIDQAIRDGAPALTVAPGDYRFGNRTLLIQDATNFALVASGAVTFWFSGSDGGFMIRHCSNVTIRGASPSTPLRVDRSPPPFSQGTITQVGLPKGRMAFTLDGDSPDPRTLQPEGRRFAYTEVCKTWRNGSQAPDGRPDSRGLPDRDPVPKGNLRACFDPTQITQVGPGKYEAINRGARVGDQFVMFVWKGFMYTVANSSAVLTEDVAIHAAGDMAVQEMDGAGGHVYRRLQIVPRNGRLISSNADAFHSSDLDRGPLLEDCHFKSMLDDFINIQTTMLFVMDVNATRVTLISPHVSDQETDYDAQTRPVVDRWYGTTEPLSRLRAGDSLIFYDPVDFHEMGRATAKSTATLLAAADQQGLPIAERANALESAVAGPRHGTTGHMGHCTDKSPKPCVPYDWSSLSGSGLTTQPIGGWNSSVYSVELDTIPPPQTRPGAMSAIPYVVVLEKTATVGAVVRNSLFEDSLGFYGRWKSSHSRLENNTFRGVGVEQLQLQVRQLDRTIGIDRKPPGFASYPLAPVQFLPSYYEGPVAIENVTVLHNSFGVDPASQATIGTILETGPSCCELKGLQQSSNSVVNGAR